MEVEARQSCTRKVELAWSEDASPTFDNDDDDDFFLPSYHSTSTNQPEQPGSVALLANITTILSFILTSSTLGLRAAPTSCRPLTLISTSSRLR